MGKFRAFGEKVGSLISDHLAEAYLAVPEYGFVDDWTLLADEMDDAQKEGAGLTGLSCGDGEYLLNWRIIPKKPAYYCRTLEFMLEDMFRGMEDDEKTEDLIIRALEESGMRRGRTQKRQRRTEELRELLPDQDLELFESLRSVRLELAREQNWPAYVVLSNQALYEMTLRKPKSSEELLEIPGIGERTADMFGKRFLLTVSKAADRAEEPCV